MGKSDVAVRLCLLLREHAGVPGEVISADSMQVYRELDVGTNKMPLEERVGVPHHLIDVMDLPRRQTATDPSSRFSAGIFIEQAATLANEVVERGGVPVVVGGTSFYVNFLLHGPPSGPERTAESAAHARNLIQAAKAEAVRAGGDANAQWDAVTRVLDDLGDPDSAALFREVRRNDYYRLERAVQIVSASGKPWAMSKAGGSVEQGKRNSGDGGASTDEVNNNTDGIKWHCVQLCPVDRPHLYASLDRRVDRLFLGPERGDTISTPDNDGSLRQHATKVVQAARTWRELGVAVDPRRALLGESALIYERLVALDDTAVDSYSPACELISAKLSRSWTLGSWVHEAAKCDASPPWAAPVTADDAESAAGPEADAQPVARAVGYRQALAYLDERIRWYLRRRAAAYDDNDDDDDDDDVPCALKPSSIEALRACRESVRTATRTLARKQLKWFRSDKGVAWRARDTKKASAGGKVAEEEEAECLAALLSLLAGEVTPGEAPAFVPVGEPPRTLTKEMMNEMKRYVSPPDDDANLGRTTLAFGKKPKENVLSVDAPTRASDIVESGAANANAVACALFVEAWAYEASKIVWKHAVSRVVM